MPGKTLGLDAELIDKLDHIDNKLLNDIGGNGGGGGGHYNYFSLHQVAKMYNLITTVHRALALMYL